MTLEAWTEAGWLRAHDTRVEEIAQLWGVLEDDLKSARSGDLSPSSRFEYAYNASLKLCLVLLFACDRRLGRVGEVHHTIIRVLPLVLGSGRETSADYLDACRERRDKMDTHGAPDVCGEDADALATFARALRDDVAAFLRVRKPDAAFMLLA
ncbi:hypothetical protein ASA1KI_04310 [Opitutales bacterium ASA1]|uniref:hypothetical protein n=1 Tax=Congregicoccus parvus TaxID=3081749 RepID=UPI002B2DB248|nr:hypothetical protein ASA1KI_04310 [Opitutales bacterium ASA1]